MFLPKKSGKSNFITSDDILGQKVIDKDGAIIGVVEKVLIDPKTMQFAAISVDKGLIKKGLTIGAEYIRTITPHAVILDIKPAYEIKGLSVFDDVGKLIGTVKGITLEEQKNKITNLIVSAKGTKTIRVHASLIKNVGKNIFLSVPSKVLIDTKKNQSRK